MDRPESVSQAHRVIMQLKSQTGWQGERIKQLEAALELLGSTQNLKTGTVLSNVEDYIDERSYRIDLANEALTGNSYDYTT